MYDPLATIERYYAGYYLKVDFFENHACLYVYDYLLTRPLVYASSMNKAQAQAYIKIFETVGYIPVN